MKKFLGLAGFLIAAVVFGIVFFFHGQLDTALSADTPTKQTENNTHSDFETLPAQTENSTSSPAANTDIMLVNATHLLSYDYQPYDLVNLYEQKGRHFQLARADIQVCKAAFDAMDAMFAAANEDGIEGFIITSGYRSFSEQTEVFAETTDGTAAKPGASEHQTGLAFDVSAFGNDDFELTPQYEWLSKHCAEYGFILRYPKGTQSITGYPYEPWHYRYVGTPYASEIMSAGITLEEYLSK